MDSSGSGRIREHVARVACNSCRSRKLRCDTNRPACTTCLRAARTCEYDTKYTYETRSGALRRENLELRLEIDRLRKQVHASPDEIHQHRIFPSAEDARGLEHLADDDSSGVSSGQTVQSHLTERSDSVPKISVVKSWQENVRSESDFQFEASPSFANSDDTAAWTIADRRTDNSNQHGEAAARMLDALVRSDDEHSSFLLASLRVSSPWRDLVDKMALSSDGREFGVLRVMHSKYDHEQEFQIQDMSHETISKAIVVDSGAIDDVSGSENDSSSWLLVSFDRLHWARRQIDRDARGFLGYKHHACHDFDHIIFSSSWNHHFGNLDLSSAVDANNHPKELQELQKRNLSAPIWAMRLMNDPQDQDPFGKIIMDICHQYSEWRSAEDYCGLHAYLAALSDREAFQSAPRLSQHVARLIKSIKPDEIQPSSTQYALMAAFWALIRWSLDPSKDSYDAIPAFYRPSPWQYFVMHAHVVDFAPPVHQREYLCRKPTPDLSWLTEACKTIEVVWDRNKNAFSHDPRTGQYDLSAECKAEISRLESWTWGPSVRAYLPNADHYMRIRH